MQELLTKLEAMRMSGGDRLTSGVARDALAPFLADDALLRQAIEEAHSAFVQLRNEYPQLIAADEKTQTEELQRGYVNFYAREVVNPYVALAARGPWIITSKGAVIHDSGGYGMLGLGHAPQHVLDALSRPYVMANVMTPSFSQKRLLRALQKEIGHTRKDDLPLFESYLCLNSGSEAVTVAARISDINAKIHTDPGGRHAGKPIRMLSLRGGFHGRTDRPAQFSHATQASYRKHLASFRDNDRLLVVEPNDIDELERTFVRARAQNQFIESMFLEPVMGEGNPGQAITPAFYRRARELTLEHGSMLLVDSIQAGLRAQGVLSIVDYPGFENEAAPDMESYSKALNAGQYPFSVLALNKRAADCYRTGVYGNTMTTNPRAIAGACAVLDSMSDELRANIRLRGAEFIDKLSKLADELDGAITKVQGTGLLFSCEVSDDFKAFGSNSLEEYLRMHGIGVIHGGKNSLRFTPHFAISSEEVDLIVDSVRHALEHAPRLNTQPQAVNA